jgi:predicted Rossmann fold nucleotide-binding protein DprA/Smf involved in DNA uptake
VDQPQQIITELALQLRPLVERYQTPDTQKTPHTAFDADLTEELQLLLRLFSYDPVTVDILCAQLAQPYNIVAAKLTELELLGLVRVTSAGYEKVY